MGKVVNKKSIMKKTANVAFWLVLILVVVYSMTALFAEEESNMRSLFGINALSVQSDSMSPTFVKGDLIFVNTNVAIEDILPEDVITYRQMVTNSQGQSVMIFNSHRVKAINIINGSYWFSTQGDAEAPDSSPVFQTDIIGVWTGGKLSGFGSFADSFMGFLKSSLGFFLFIVVPCFLFLVYEIFRFVKVMSEYNVNKNFGDRAQIQVEALALARAQIEAELRQKLAEQQQADQKQE